MEVLNSISQWLYNRWYTVIVLERWNAVRFMLGAAMLGVAAPEQWALIYKIRAVSLYSNIYFFAAFASAISGLYYLHIGSDRREMTVTQLRRRYFAEVVTTAIWLWVFSIDVQAHTFGALQLGEAEWVHHVGVNIVVLSGLALSAYNEQKVVIRQQVYDEIEIDTVLLSRRLEEKHG